MGSGQGCQPFFPSGHRPGLPVFPARQGGSLVFLAHQLTSALAHYRGFIKTGAEGAHYHPLNPLNLLNPLNPHATGVSAGAVKPKNLKNPRGRAPSPFPLNPLNRLNPWAKPHPPYVSIEFSLDWIEKIPYNRMYSILCI